MFEKHLVFKGHSAPIYALAFDQNFIYSSAGDKLVTRWNKLSGEQDAFVVRLEDVAYSLGIFVNLLLVGSTKGTLYAINTETKQLEWERNLFGHPIFSICVNSDLKRIYFGDSEGNLVAMNEMGEKLISFPLGTDKIRTIQSIENKLFVGTNSGDFFQFEEESFNEVNHFKFEFPISSMEINTSEKTCHFGSRDAHFYTIDSSTGQVVQKLPLHLQTIYGISSFGSIIVTVSMDKSIKIWNKDSFEIVQRIELKNGGHSR